MPDVGEEDGVWVNWRDWGRRGDERLRNSVGDMDLGC